jgi:hypothetical protein
MSKLDLLSTPGNAPPASLTVPQQALWWLKKGEFTMGAEWEKAHTLCQMAEGTREYDLVHALAHWIEGDESNAAYWYRKLGGGRAATIAAEWNRIAGEVAA